MIDYNLLQEIADKMKTVEDSQVRMDIVRRLSDPDKPCGCIAGWAQILFGLVNLKECAELFGFDAADALYVFQGHWHPKFQWWSQKITRQEVIAYLEKAVAEKDIYTAL